MNLLASKHGRVAATKPEGLRPANEAGSKQLLAAARGHSTRGHSEDPTRTRRLIDDREVL